MASASSETTGLGAIEPVVAPDAVGSRRPPDPPQPIANKAPAITIASRLDLRTRMSPPVSAFVPRTLAGSATLVA